MLRRFSQILMLKVVSLSQVSAALQSRHWISEVFFELHRVDAANYHIYMYTHINTCTHTYIHTHIFF